MIFICKDYPNTLQFFCVKISVVFGINDALYHEFVTLVDISWLECDFDFFRFIRFDHTGVGPHAISLFLRF